MARNVRVRRLSPDAVGFLPLDVALGRNTSIRGLHKFGHNPSFATNVAETVWTQGGIWVPPTQARIHQLASTDVNDTAAGTGARKVQIFGITDWNGKEDTETITLNGTTDVPTTKSWFTIHRMIVTLFGGTTANHGVITATADTDATVTAAIAAGEGQTQMCVYSFGHRERVVISHYFGSMGRSATAAADLSLYFRPDPKNSPTIKVLKHNLGLDTGGSTHAMHNFAPFQVFNGPGILCLEAVCSANGASISGGFEAYIVTTEED